jgi:chromosome segregation ATPase
MAVSSGAVSASMHEELAALEAAGDEQSTRAAAALRALLDDLAKAHADAASHAINNEQRFHQLEQETIAARSETERVKKLKNDAERKHEQAEARITSLSNEVTAANAKVCVYACLLGW